MAINATARKKGREVVGSLAKQVMSGGKTLARRGTHRHGSGKGVAGPRMANSLGIRWQNLPLEVQAEVYSSVSWSATNALGSRPHRIPKSGFARPILKFRWARGDASPRLRRSSARKKGFFFFKHVMHPGNKRANRFLQIPLSMYGRQNNFKVVTVANSRSFLP